MKNDITKQDGEEHGESSSTSHRRTPLPEHRPHWAGMHRGEYFFDSSHKTQLAHRCI